MLKGIYRTIILSAVAGLSIILIRCSSDSSANEARIETRAVSVRTVSLQPRPFQEYLHITGTLKARNQIDLIAEEGGVLKDIRKDKGNYVRAGDTLAVLENRVLRASYEEARAAKSQAELDYNSKNVLYGKKAISENEYLSSKYSFERANATYDLARARYDKLFIIAPISGFVNSRAFDRGAYIMPMSALYNLVDNKTLKIRAGVAERFIADINTGTPAEITFDAYPDMKLEASVDFVSQSIDPSSRTFEVELGIPNPEGRLAPEMIANLKLLRRSYQAKIVVPMDALIESESGRYVFIANNDRAQRIDVNILAVYEDSVLVEGLYKDQSLVVVGQRDLTDGDPLDIIN